MDCKGCLLPKKFHLSKKREFYVVLRSLKTLNGAEFEANRPQTFRRTSSHHLEEIEMGCKGCLLQKKFHLPKKRYSYVVLRSLKTLNGAEFEANRPQTFRRSFSHHLEENEMGCKGCLLPKKFHLPKKR